ncbi:MAG: nucleotidyltransferase family protein [Clostridia bacterium]|nr:nucleotidyltransferase family protein [Clostridia bacterium]
MKHVGIICEFNPFHQGHAHLIRQVKKAFPEKAVVCLMSGNFVQRGDFAVMEKYSRAAAVLSSGADLVLELPSPFSALSAEAFGRSGVSVLSRLGVVDTLAFGSERDDAKALLYCAERLASPQFAQALEAFLREHKGIGYPAAREAVYTALYGSEPLFGLSNASLALEYLIASLSLLTPLTPFPVKRIGQDVRGEEPEGAYPSATSLRKRIAEGERALPLPQKVLEQMRLEEEAGRFPVFSNALFPTLVYLLKTKSEKELSEIYGLAPLLHRARRFAGEATCLEELVLKMKNASFTDSRIRRSLLALLCGTPRRVETETPAYTLLLGANERGRELLSEIREKGGIPVFTKPAHAFRSKDPNLLRQASRAFLADEIYAMAFPRRQEEGFFFKQHPTML